MGLAAGFGQSTSVLEGSESILEQPGVSSVEPVRADLVDADVVYYPDFFARERADELAGCWVVEAPFTPERLLASSPVTRMIANFFIGMGQVPMPMRMFTDETEALRWLRS